MADRAAASREEIEAIRRWVEAGMPIDTKFHWGANSPASEIVRVMKQVFQDTTKLDMHAIRLKNEDPAQPSMYMNRPRLYDDRNVALQVVDKRDQTVVPVLVLVLKKYG